MDFDNRQEMLLQHEDRHAVGRHEFRGNNLGCRERGSGNGDCERAEQEPSGSRMSDTIERSNVAITVFPALPQWAIPVAWV